MMLRRFRDFPATYPHLRQVGGEIGGGKKLSCDNHLPAGNQRHPVSCASINLLDAPGYEWYRAVLRNEAKLDSVAQWREVGGRGFASLFLLTMNLGSVCFRIGSLLFRGAER